MAIPVMIIGESGSGKSTSLRNFMPGECAIINVSGKPLPFRTDEKPVNTDSYATIVKALSDESYPSFAIDDASYLMTNEFMRNAKVTGFQKFTDMALNFFNLVQHVIRRMPEDRIVYFLGHVDQDQFGREHFKTIGKLLDEKVTLEGLFTVVLKTVVQDGKYQFSTQTNGADTCKSPMGMFDQPLIDNDLKFVDDAIRKFWNLERKIQA